VVPGSADNAINDNGTANVVQINVGNPDWTLNRLLAGNGGGDGAFLQNGQTLTLSNASRAFRLGVAAANTGVYTLNGGTINYNTGGFDVGELGTGILNINGGSIVGSGNFAANFGVSTANVNASMDGGRSLSGTTWFEQGFDGANPAIGLPLPGSTIISNVFGADHSYTFAPSYTTNDAVMIGSNEVTSATITLTSPTACSALSFLGSCGNGTMTVSYTVHHADSSTETGSLTFLDWFNSSGTIVFGAGGRVNADGSGVADFSPNTFPYLFAEDASLTGTVSPVTKIDLAYASSSAVDTHACVLAVSSSTGGAFSPLSITGYNESMIVVAGAVTTVSSTITDIVNQASGALTLTNGGQLFVGNFGVGIYNLSGGTIDANNWIVTGRSGGNGTFNMTGGTINKNGGGSFVVSSRNGGASVATFNQSGGTINTPSEYWIGQGDNTAAGAFGTNYISGTAVLNVTNWLAVGREGGIGVLNISGGSIIKTGGGNLTITHGTGASGTVNQSGGSFTIASGQAWIGEDSGSAIWNMSGGTANVGVVHIVQNASANGTLNLSGGVMTLQELTTGNALGISTLTLNGGTLQASADTATFLHDITIVNVSSPGGAIFDSQNFNITVPQAMPNNGGDGSGGLTKIGSGTLTLTGANSYTGPTVVNAGTLIVDTTSTANGAYTVADSASLSVGVKAANAQLNMANFTLASSTAASLNVDLGVFGNPTSAPLNTSGTLAVNGAITINLADATPQLGQFPLIKYVTRTGAGSFVLGSLPVGVTATISNNTLNSSVDVVFTTVNAPRWEGLAGGNWDIGLTTNWINIGNGQPTFYTEGSPVVFNDAALGTTSVNLVATVHPSLITVNNTSLNYTFTGTGKISGSIGLNKQGSGSLSILNTGGNNYTGPTVITGGTLSVTNLANGGSPSPIGASSANPTNLVFAGGTLSYSGAPVSVNRGYTVQTTPSTIDTESDLALSGVVVGGTGTFNKTGPGQLAYTAVTSSNSLCNPGVSGSTYLIQAGTVLLDGSAGAQTNYVRNLNLGSTAGVNAAIILTNTTLVCRTLQLGNNVNCTGTLVMNNNSTLTMAANNFAVGISPGAGSPSAGVFTQNAGSALDSSAELWIGQGPSGVGTYNMNGGSAIFRNWVAIGRNGGTATFNMTGGTITKTPNNNFMIGSRDGTTGTIGTLNQSGGSIFCGSEYWIGEAQNNLAGATGTNNISGTASVIVSNWVAIGREGGVGVLNLSGGSFTKLGNSGNHLNIGDGGPGASGTINQTGGALTNTISDTYLGDARDGVWNMSGGTANLLGLVFCLQSGCTNGTLNLNGGVLTAAEIRAGATGAANLSTLNFNGGTIAAANNANANFLHNLTTANIQSGGAVIDSGTNLINIAQPLLNGGGGGGLTKLGNGTLRLNGINTYTGTTLVSAGTLGGTGVISGPVSVASGASLAPGASIGTLTINNTLTLAAGSTVVAKVSLDGGVTNNDQVIGLTSVSYAGTLIVTNVGSIPLLPGTVFKLFTAASASGNFTAPVTVLPTGAGTFNPATGQLTITSSGVVALNPVTVSGGNFILTGNGGTAGGHYTVLTATNPVIPVTSWTTNVSGTLSGTGAFSNAIPINVSEPVRFFRVRTP
jgi:autotransporter-associated beta strand protein